MWEVTEKKWAMEMIKSTECRIKKLKKNIQLQQLLKGFLKNSLFQSSAKFIE